jgi:hypothetical protein
MRSESRLVKATSDFGARREDKAVLLAFARVALTTRGFGRLAIAFDVSKVDDVLDIAYWEIVNL